MKNIITLIIGLFSIITFAQEYKFIEVVDIEASRVKSQGKTGTCWSFSGSSFIESEIYRMVGKNIDVSEMYTVRNIYEDKAWNYVMRQGKAQFSQGGLAHDVFDAIETDGLVPENAFSGFYVDKIYDHSKIIPNLKTILDGYIKNDKDSDYVNWKQEVNVILDKEIGKKPKRFTFEGKTYTPKSFASMLKVNKSDYVTLTSFSHKPYYSKFILNIPDNFSNGSMFNMPINELTDLAVRAIKKGYSIALDVDVSEKTFSAKKGLALLPKSTEENEKGLNEIVIEKEITQEFRQSEFENYNTTDDHLMHIVGLLKDQNNNLYFKVKNSWGTNSKRIGNNGFVYMSVPYFKLKVISVLLHKDAITKKMRKKIGL